MYPPLSLQMEAGMDMTIFAIHLMGASWIMGVQLDHHHVARRPEL